MAHEADNFGTSPMGFDPGGSTLSEALEAFTLSLRVSGRSAATIRLYRRSIKPLIDFLEDKDPEQVTKHDLRHFIVHLQERLNTTTVGIRWRSVRAFFNWLEAEGWITRSPAASIKHPKVPKSYPNVLSQVEADALLQTAKKEATTWHGQRNYAMVLTFLDTGVRRAELQQITLDDLDLRRHMIRVTGKGSRDREVYFGQRLARALRKWLKHRSLRLPGDALFCSRQGQPINRGEISKIVSGLAREAQLNDGISCHTLRHTFATFFIQNGGDPFSLQRLLGHADIQTTMIYVHMAGKALREAHAKASPLDKLME